MHVLREITKQAVRCFRNVCKEALPREGDIEKHRLKNSILVIFIFTFGLYGSLQAEENLYINEGYSHIKNGETEAALEAFNRALETDRNAVPALLGQGMIFSQKEQHEEAFASYSRIVSLIPDHAFAWNGRGLAAYNLEDFDTALTSFEQATINQPVNGFFYESLAWTKMCRGDFIGAAQSAKQATLMYNRNGEVSLYPLFIAYFSYLETEDVLNAKRTLLYAVKNIKKKDNEWPAPIVNYLVGAISKDEMIGFVRNKAEETEAHTYIGLNLRSMGYDEEASKHIRWVAKNGDSQVFEYTLARAINLQTEVAQL